jgi:hypothetical protein
MESPVIIRAAQVNSVDSQTHAKGSMRVVEVVFVPDMHPLDCHLNTIQEGESPAQKGRWRGGECFCVGIVFACFFLRPPFFLNALIFSLLPFNSSKSPLISTGGFSLRIFVFLIFLLSFLIPLALLEHP